MTDQTKLLQTVEEYSQAAGVCKQRIGQLLRAGRIPGARKIGRDWLIPTGTVWDMRPPGRPRGTKNRRKTVEVSEPY